MASHTCLVVGVGCQLGHVSLRGRQRSDKANLHTNFLSVPYHVCRYPIGQSKSFGQSQSHCGRSLPRVWRWNSLRTTAMIIYHTWSCKDMGCTRWHQNHSQGFLGFSRLQAMSYFLVNVPFTSGFGALRNLHDLETSPPRLWACHHFHSGQQFLFVLFCFVLTSLNI